MLTLYKYKLSQKACLTVSNKLDDLQFYILFNSISFISGPCADDNEIKAVCNGTLFTAEKISP